MKKTIVVADRDESLQHAFMTVFSREHFEIIHASNGKEVEKIAERIRPDVYVVNVNLPKVGGIEVYKKLQKQGLLETASFYFLKDESDTTELLGYQAAGVIEKPVNLFRVYETITKEDEVIELTDLVEERQGLPGRQAGEYSAGDREGATSQNAAREESVTTEEQKEVSREETALRKDVTPPTPFEDRLRDAIDGLSSSVDVGRAKEPAVSTDTAEAQIELEAELKLAINQTMEEAAKKLAGQIAPILGRYIEDHVKRTLLEVAEKVIREEIDKLLKESTG
jgi:DNA-binding response OmpR family regulator